MPKYNIVLAPAPDGGIWAYWIPHPLQDAEFHVFHRINFLCEMPRDWGGLFRLEFLNTTVCSYILFLIGLLVSTA